MSYMNKYGFDICQNLYQDQSKEIHNEYHFRSPNGFYLGGLRTCIHKRLSRVLKCEIMTIATADETEIS